MNVTLDGGKVDKQNCYASYSLKDRRVEHEPYMYYVYIAIVSPRAEAWQRSVVDTGSGLEFQYFLRSDLTTALDLYTAD